VAQPAPIRLWLAATLLLLAASMCAIAWQSRLRQNARLSVLGIPFAPTRGLALFVGADGPDGRAPTRHPYLYYRAPLSRITTLWLGLWYQNRAAGTNRALVVIRLPIWPLIPLAAAQAIAAVWIWRRGSRGRWWRLAG
jgi:hypothetical protein